VAASALSDAEDYADGVTDATPRVFRQATAPSTSNRSDSSIREGDVWYNTDEGDKPYSYDGTSPYNASGWIRSYTEIDGGNITTGTIDANLVTVSGGGGDVILSGDGLRVNPSGSNQDVLINGDGINLAGGSDEFDYAKTLSLGGSGLIYFGTNATTGASEALFITTNAGDNIHISPGASSTSTTGNLIISLFPTQIGAIDSYVDINGGYITIDFNEASTSADTGAIRVTDGGIGVSEASFFGSTVTVGNASANGHALNRTTGDGRYGRLATQSTYTADQIFEADRLNIKATSNTGLASFTYANTATDRTIAIPSLGGNRTMAFIDQEQGWNADQTFAFGRLLLRNTGGNGSASINYGTASADRTYTFAGSNGTVWTSGNLDIEAGGQVSVQPNETLEITIDGNTYRIEAEQI
jgi:hypothetical protein